MYRSMNWRWPVRRFRSLPCVFSLLTLVLPNSLAAADPTHRCSGTVVDAGGKPIERATLFSEYSNDAGQRRTSIVQTDGNGSFTLEYESNLSDTRLIMIWVYARNHAIRAIMVEPDFRETRHVAGIRIPMREPATIRMRFTGPNGKPIQDGRVAPREMRLSKVRVIDGECKFDDSQATSGSLPDEFARIVGQTVGNDGVVMMNRCHQDRHQLVQIQSERYGNQVCWYREGDNNFMLTTVGQIKGNVRTDDPSLIAGTRLYFTSRPDAGRRSFATVKINDQGEFFVPAITPSSRLSITSDWDPDLPVHPVSLKRPLTVVAGKTLTIEIDAVPTVQVNGQVLTEDTRQPVPNAQVFLHSTTSIINGIRSTTDQRGRFELWIAPGSTRQRLNISNSRGFAERYASPDLGFVDIPIDVETFQLERYLLQPR